VNARPHGPANMPPEELQDEAARRERQDDAAHSKTPKKKEPDKPEFTYNDLLAQTPYEYDDRDDPIQTPDWPYQP
jgi:hypothetical protein